MMKPSVRIIALALVVMACTAQPMVAPSPPPSPSFAATSPPATSSPVPVASPTPVGSPSPSTGPPGPSPNPNPSPSRIQRSVLRIGVTGDPKTFGLVETQQEDWKVELLFDRLFELDASLRPQPSLALGMPEISPDGSEWTVRLPDGVRFHDGSPLEADDMVAAFELLGAKTCTGTPMLCRAVRSDLRSVEAIDPLTVRFRVRPPAVAFLADALAQAPIRPSDAMAEALAALDARLSGIRPAELRAADRAMLSAHESCGTARWWPDVVETTGCEAPPELISVVERLLAAGLLPLPQQPLETQTDALAGLLWHLARIARADGSERMARALPLLPLAEEPIGSGPFRFEGRTDPHTVELVAHDGHWAGPAVMSSVTIRWFGWPSNEHSLTAAIRREELDWVPHGAERRHGPAGLLDWVDSAGLGVFYLALDTEPTSIFSDVNVRLALDRCVDRTEIVEQSTDGAGRSVRSPIHPSSWAFAEMDAPRSGPEEARRLLEEAGWRMVDGTYERDGRRLEADLGSRPGGSERLEFLGRLRIAARPCGFDLSVREVEITIGSGQEAEIIWRLYDGYLTGWGTLSDPDHAYDAFHQSADPLRDGPAHSTPWNIMRWQDQAASDALDLGRASADPAVRLAAYRTFQERLAADMPVIWGWADWLDAAISPDITVDGAPLDLSHPRYFAGVERWRVGGP